MKAQLVHQVSNDLLPYRRGFAEPVHRLSKISHLRASSSSSIFSKEFDADIPLHVTVQEGLLEVNDRRLVTKSAGKTKSCCRTTHSITGCHQRRGQGKQIVESGIALPEVEVLDAQARLDLVSLVFVHPSGAKHRSIVGKRPRSGSDV